MLVVDIDLLRNIIYIHQVVHWEFVTIDILNLLNKTNAENCFGFVMNDKCNRVTRPS